MGKNFHDFSHRIAVISHIVISAGQFPESNLIPVYGMTNITSRDKKLRQSG